MTPRHHTHALLKSMDAAHDAPPANAHRAQMDLERIIAQSPTGSRHNVPSAAPKVTRQPAARASRAHRGLVIGGLVAAATTALLVVPALTAGDPAFATWTASPTPLTGSDLEEADAECRSARTVGDDVVDTVEVAIAERRGAWVTVILTGADGYEATCITDASALIRGGNMVGSSGRPTAADPAPRALKATQLGVGQVSDDGPLSMASGRAGSDVTGITYTSIEGDEVIATVSKGHFAFWLPGDEFDTTADAGLPVIVTYTDGTTEAQSLNF
ncbi:hypothetical protein [Arthrobacter sp. TMS2-4]